MTNVPALALGKVCAACGKERKSKALKYDPATFLPYCDNPYICSDDHPNSPKNLIQNQKETALFDLAQANEAYRKHLKVQYANSDTVEKIHRMLTHPTTIRIQDPDMAVFLVDLEEELGLDNLSDTIRYCIQVVKENNGVFRKEYQAIAQDKKESEAIDKAIKQVEDDDDDDDNGDGDFGTF